jgi:hypothetical protein
MLRITKKLLILLILVSLNPLYVHAEDSGIEIAPAFEEIKIKPGEEAIKSFNIKNHNEYPVAISLSLGEIVNDEIKVDNLQEGTSTSWINLSTKEISIASLEEFVVNYSVTVPKTATDGIYQPLILMKISSLEDGPGTKTTITQLIPYQISLRVSPKDNYDAVLNLDKLYIETLVFDETANIETSLKNISTDLSKPIIRFQIVNPWGEVVRQEVFNEKLDKLLPNKSLENNIQYTFNFYDFSNIGKYKVEIYSVDTLNSRTVSASGYFYVIPLPLVLTFITIIATIFFGVRIFKANKENIKLKPKKTYYK